MLGTKRGDPKYHGPKQRKIIRAHCQRYYDRLCHEIFIASEILTRYNNGHSYCFPVTPLNWGERLKPLEGHKHMPASLVAPCSNLLWLGITTPFWNEVYGKIAVMNVYFPSSLLRVFFLERPNKTSLNFGNELKSSAKKTKMLQKSLLNFFLFDYPFWKT